MNHIYKLIWCTASSCWVAVSELAVGVRKNSTKVAKALAIVPLVGVSSLVSAETEIIEGDFTAPIPLKEGSEFLIRNTTVSIDADTYTGNSIMQGTYLIGNNTTTKVDVLNYSLSLTGTAPSITAFSGLEARATNGAEINLSGTNKFVLDHAGADTALLASSWTSATNSGNGSAKINIKGTLDILNKGTKDNFERDGVEVNAYNGDAVINHTGSGKIETEAGNAIFAKQRDGNGNVEIILNSDLGKDAIELITHGNSNVSPDQWLGHHGISAAIYKADSVGSININSNAKITTEGNLARGIYSQHKGIGDNKITNSGTIRTLGEDSHALYAYNDNILSDGKIIIKNTGNLTTDGNISSAIGINNMANGGVSIENSGNIETKGSKAHGFYVNTNKGEVFIQSSVGTISTSGNTSHGIYADVGTDKKVTIENSSNINVTGGKLDANNKASIGILANQKGTGELFVDNKGNISTVKNSSHAVYGIIDNTPSTSILSIINAGTLTTSGKVAYGIFAENKGSGKTIVNNSGNIHINASNTKAETAAQSSYGIFVKNEGTQNGNDIDVTNTGNISTTGYDNAAIRIVNVNTKGNIDVVSSGDINVTGENSDGIFASTYVANSESNISVRTGASNITIGNAQATDKISNNFGIVAFHEQTGAKGNISIVTNSTNITTNQDKNGTAELSSAVYAGISSDSATGNILISGTNGIFLTQGSSSHGLYALQKGLGNVDIESTGATIATNGKNSNGLYGFINNVNSNGKITITNASTIKTTGTSTYGVFGEHKGLGDIRIGNGGTIETKNGIAVTGQANGNVAIINDANLTASNQITNTTTGAGSNSAHGIQAISKNGLASVYHRSGVITVENKVNNHSAHGIAAWSNNSNAPASARATVRVGSNAIVDAAKGNGGIFLQTTGDGNIQIDTGAKVIGGKDAGILFGITNNAQNNYEIKNDGHISSTNDHAIKVSGSAAISKLELVNSGIIQGYVTSSEQTALNMKNSGQFLIRNQNGSTKNVSISKFNGGTIDNTGLISLMEVNGLTANITDEYKPAGAMSTSNEGIVQGQLLGVNKFNHSGILDLRGSGLSGNTLVISGAQTAGTNGNGTFIADGGVMQITTTLNEGAAASRSDMLIVDNLEKGRDSTKIDLTIAAGSSDLKTVGSGIQVVKTLGTQEAGAFELLTPVTYGRYEYLLFSDNAAGASDGYYLRNKLINPTKPPIYLPNPNIGAYLGNQYAAANMFNQNILDRRDNVQSPDQTVWGRINYNENKTDHMSGTQKLKTENTLLQIGADFYRNDEKGHVAGAYFGYGKSDITNTSYLTGSKAKGDVRGLQIGGYYSWIPEQDKGPYVDVWGHYANYSNKLKGKAQKNHDTKYDGYGLAISAEGGYSFALTETDANKWLLKPHLQLTYSHLNMDDFTDTNNTRFSNNKSDGLQTRLGARFYGYKKQDANGILPFVEANWLHNGMSNEISVNGHKESSKLGKNVGELKLGIQGNITKSSSIFVHVGFQKGDHSYKRTTGQIGYNYNWQ